ncbi:MAG: glycosyltransferase family 2 protein [Proteobacteria bacterium]|nr:glycosyltransferase family 2 protein [Pseudomonadota bacterium]
MGLSIIIPAKNEAEGLGMILPDLTRLYPDAEILVVNDGSTDDTNSVCNVYNVTQVKIPIPMGNGAAIKAGTRASSGDILIFLDADGQHRPNDIERLLEKLNQGFKMVVGARSASSQASIGRLCANNFYNWFASNMVGQKVEDLTSGFRVVRAEYFKRFLYLLPNGFSYPTTCTMAFFRSGYSVGYVPIEANKRLGKSHIKLIKDGVRFLLILFKIGTLYSPLKIFLPISVICFVTGFTYYMYTYLISGRFTNMSALLFTTSILIFLMGLISEQITSLLYSRSENK